MDVRRRNAHLSTRLTLKVISSISTLVLILMVIPLQSFARNDMEFELTPELIAKIRAAHALWLPVEAGAPIVYVGRLPDRLDQLGEEPDAEAEEVLQGAEILLSHGSLLPATYTLANFWKNYFPEGKCPIGPDTSACIAIPASAQLRFNLTDKHLKLLRKANTREVFEGSTEGTGCAARRNAVHGSGLP